MLRVGITGNIGSGKSKVSSILKDRGYSVFDADTEAKKCMIQEPVKSQLIQLLGKDVYLENGELNRQLIASQVFSDPGLLTKLNAIVHPVVKNNFQTWAVESQQNIVFKEAAILLEAGGQHEVDFIVVVDCPKEIRLERVIKRDQSSPEEVLKRMDKQWSDEEKRKYADFVILNDGNEALEPQIDKLISVLESKI
jgi:dephospho-CoA kinase